MSILGRTISQACSPHCRSGNMHGTVLRSGNCTELTALPRWRVPQRTLQRMLQPVSLLGECSRAIEALGERPRTVTGPSEATNLRVATASFISALQSRVQSRALHAGVLLPPPRRRLTAAVGPPKPGIILAWPGAMCQSPGYRTRCQRSSVGTLRIPFGT